MSIADWDRRWEALRAACARHHATDRWLEGESQPAKFIVEPAASEAEIEAMEQRIGFALPVSFRKVLVQYSRRVDIAWQLRDEANERPFKGIFAGECRWSLDGIPALLAEHRKWVEVAFPDFSDPYDRVWHNKFPVLMVGTSDFIGINIEAAEHQRVVYMSRDDSFSHGYWLGTDFEDYIDRLSLLGCVGAEDWQWEPFTNGPRSLLEPYSEAAHIWREWFGLHFTATPQQ